MEQIFNRPKSGREKGSSILGQARRTRLLLDLYKLKINFLFELLLLAQLWVGGWLCPIRKWASAQKQKPQNGSIFPLKRIMRFRFRFPCVQRKYSQREKDICIEWRYLYITSSFQLLKSVEKLTLIFSLDPETFT